MHAKRGIFKTTLLFFCILFIVPYNITFGDSSEQTNELIVQSNSLGKVTLKSNVTAEVKNLMSMPSGNQQMISLMITVNNNSNSTVNFIDYWVDLYTKSGTKLSVQLENNSQNIISAKTSKDFVFFSKTGNDVKITDVVIKVIEWDFRAADNKKVLGEINVPQRYNPVTPAGNGKVFNVDEIETSMYIKQATIGKSEQFFRPSIRLVIKNEGKRTIELPDFKFYIQTQDQLMYPLTANGVKGTALDPLMDKEFLMTASIPIKATDKGWKVVAAYQFNEGKEQLSVAQFELPKSEVKTGTDLQKYYTYTNAYGVYNVKLNSINRLPIEDEDLISTNLTIQNKNDGSLPAPNLTAKYLFDDSIEIAASVINSNKMLALQPGQTMDLQVVGKIPYTYDVSKVQLVLQEKDADSNTVTDLVSFTHSGSFTPIPQIKWDQGFKVTDVGYRSSVKYRDVMVFKGSGADILAVQLLLTNEEKRAAEIQQLAGYFEKEDGTVYTATIQTLSEKVSPNGNALLYAWATIPKDSDLNGVKFVIGKAVVESSTSGDDKPASVTGYVSPYVTNLKEEESAQEGLQNIDLYPYQLSITRVRTQMDFMNSRVSLDFDYTLDRDLLTKVDMKDHKIMIELEDTDEDVIFSRSLEIKDSTSGSATEAALVVGKRTIQLEPWTDYDIVMNLQTLKDYRLNVYYEIQPGHKKLLASETIPWLVNRTLKQVEQ